MDARQGRDEAQEGGGRGAGIVHRRTSELKGTEANSRMWLGEWIKNPGRLKLTEYPSGSSWENRNYVNHSNGKHPLWRAGESRQGSKKWTHPR